MDPLKINFHENLKYSSGHGETAGSVLIIIKYNQLEVKYSLTLEPSQFIPAFLFYIWDFKIFKWLQTNQELDRLIRPGHMANLPNW